jgi:hypothetical protein
VSLRQRGRLSNPSKNRKRASNNRHLAANSSPVVLNNGDTILENTSGPQQRNTGQRKTGAIPSNSAAAQPNLSSPICFKAGRRRSATQRQGELGQTPLTT